MAQPVSLTLTGPGVSPWKNLNFRQAPFNAGFSCFVTGVVSFSIETTNSDYLTPGRVVNVSPSPIVASAVGTSASITTPARAWRLNLLSGAGSVTVEAIQAGY